MASGPEVKGVPYKTNMRLLNENHREAVQQTPPFTPHVRTMDETRQAAQIATEMEKYKLAIIVSAKQVGLKQGKYNLPEGKQYCEDAPQRKEVYALQRSTWLSDGWEAVIARIITAKLYTKYLKGSSHSVLCTNKQDRVSREGCFLCKPSTNHEQAMTERLHLIEKRFQCKGRSGHQWQVISHRKTVFFCTKECTKTHGCHLTTLHRIK